MILPPGTHLNKGHVRYHAPRELRGKQYHRVIVERLIEDTPYSLRLYIPYPFEVHHIDFDKTHNEPSNFLLISPEFHSCLTSHHRNGNSGRFIGKATAWKYRPKYQQLTILEKDREVPF